MCIACKELQGKVKEEMYCKVCKEKIERKPYSCGYLNKQVRDSLPQMTYDQLMELADSLRKPLKPYVDRRKVSA